jgi:YidC/Oxa1 family membrane protein insertase
VQPPQAILHRAGKVERHAPDALLTQSGYDGDFRFAGINDHYFIATVVKSGPAHSEFVPVTLPGVDGQAPRRLVSMALTFAKPPADVAFFVGPKQFDLLRSVDAELVRAIDFGMFAWLVVPLLGALKWLFGFVGNYGFSIIALTIGLNLVMFPLRHKSTVAMRKMQAIQPRMKAIQDRYASLKITDPARQKMNEEIAELYKKEGVNPASGCVPMLLTLPVLLAFYALLSQSIELRGAPFVGWIHDLSTADPYYVLPDPDGCDHDVAAVAHSGRRGPGAAEGDDGDAHHVHRHDVVVAERRRVVLVREPVVGHRPAVLHELDDWTGLCSPRAPPPAASEDAGNRRRSA